MMRLAAALSSFLAARSYSFWSCSTDSSAAPTTRLTCVLSDLMTARLWARRFSVLRRFLRALRVCGIDPLRTVPEPGQIKGDYKPPFADDKRPPRGRVCD